MIDYVRRLFGASKVRRVHVPEVRPAPRIRCDTASRRDCWVRFSADISVVLSQAPELRLARCEGWRTRTARRPPTMK